MGDTRQPGDPVEGMPGWVYVNPQWPLGTEPCMERSDDEVCTACGGDGEVSIRTEWPRRDADIETVPCNVCGGKGTIGRRED